MEFVGWWEHVVNVDDASNDGDVIGGAGTEDCRGGFLEDIFRACCGGVLEGSCDVGVEVPIGRLGNRSLVGGPSCGFLREGSS